MLRWDDAKWFNGIFALVLIGLAAFRATRHLPIGEIVIILPVPLGFLLATYVNRLLSYLEISSEGLKIRYRLTTLRIPYTSISRVRKQSLGAAFQPAERRRYLNRFVRRVAKDPAVYIRLDRREADLLAEAERRLGPRMVAGADIVLPVTDADTVVSELKSRLKGSS
jgi:hypothetical protein